MPACSAVPVVLTAAERHRLKKMAYGHKSPHHARQRATIVLLAARGRSNARLVEFERRLPGRIAEPKRERSERFVRWSWRAQAAVAAALIVAVFLLGNTLWWLALLVPHLLAALSGWSIEVTASRHRAQVRVAAALHVLCLLVVLVSTGVLSAGFIIAIVVGWFVIAVASGATAETVKGRAL